MSESASGAVSVRELGAVTVIRLHRPDRLNALNTSAFEELAVALRGLHESAARVVVITGAGRAFSAGGDTGDVTAIGSWSEQVEALRGKAHIVEIVRGLPQLSVAAVNGPCAGAAVGIAAACDVRYFAESAFVSTAYTALGLSGDFGVAYFLTELVGASTAKDWLLRPRRIPAAECFARGFADAVLPDVDFMSEIENIALGFASLDPDTRAAVVQNIADSQTRELSDYLDAESRRHVDSKQRARGRP